MVWALLLSTLAASSAERQEVMACISASSRGQELRDAADLLAARAQFRTCAADVCPKAIRSDCTRWLADVEQAIPSVVPVVRSGTEDVPGVEVSLDGVGVHLDGKPIELNPGPHRFSATRDGATRELSVAVSAGEHSRLVVVPWEVGAAVATPPEVKPLPEGAVVHAEEPAAPRSLMGSIVLAAVGVAGVGTFAALGASGKSELNGIQESSCAQTQTCPPGTTDGVRTKYIAADVALGVGVAALAGAALWYLLPASPVAPVSVSPNSHGVTAAWRTEF